MHMHILFSHIASPSHLVRYILSLALINLIASLLGLFGGFRTTPILYSIQFSKRALSSCFTSAQELGKQLPELE